MKLDTDKAQAMTPEFIEQQRPLFEAAFAEKYMKGLAFNFGGLDVDRNYFADWVQDRFDGWLLARSAGLSQEPVAHLKFWAAQQWCGSGNNDVEVAEGLCVCEPGEIGDDKQPAFPVFIAPPAPVSAEQPNIRDLLGEARGYLEGLELADRIDAALEDESPAAPLSDAKDSAIIAAAMKLVKAKGRYHSEGAYKCLSEAIAAKGPGK